MAGGAQRLAVQQDFGGGMNVAVRPELIPDNALVTALNGLYDEVGNVYRRGGSTMRSLSRLGAGEPLTFLWDGWLTAGQRTLMASASRFGTVSADGAVLDLAGSGVPKPARAAAMGGMLFIPGGTTYNGTALGTATTVAPYYTTVASRLLTANAARVGFSSFNDPTTVDPTDEWNIPGGVQIIGLEGLRDSAAVFTTDGIWIISGLHLNLTDADGNLQQNLDRYSSDIVLWGDAGIAAWQGALVVPAVDAVWLLGLGVKSEAAQPFQRISDDIRPLYQEYVRRGYMPGLATVYRSHYVLPILNGATPVDMLVCRLDARDRSGKSTYPWSRMTGFGSQCSCVAVHKEPGVPKPALMGASAAPTSGRLLNLSMFEPGFEVSVDADGSSFPWDVLLRSYATGQLNENTATKLRVNYLLDGGSPLVTFQDPTDWGEFDWGTDDWGGSISTTTFAVPTMKAYVLEGHPGAGASEWGLFDWGAGEWSSASNETPLVGEAPLDAFGTTPYTWLVVKQDRHIQFRLRVESNASLVQLKSVELIGRSNRRL